MLNQSFPDLRRMRLDRRQPVATQIFDHLRQEIVSLRLAPGTILSRPALAESFGVSQTPIRDALCAWSRRRCDGAHPQSSTMVAPIDVDQGARGAVPAHLARVRGRGRSPSIRRRTTSRRRSGCSRTCTRPRERDSDKPTFIARDLGYHRAMFRTTGRRGSGSWSSSAAATSTGFATCTCRRPARRRRSSPTTTRTSTP